MQSTYVLGSTTGPEPSTYWKVKCFSATKGTVALFNLPCIFWSMNWRQLSASLLACRLKNDQSSGPVDRDQYSGNHNQQYSTNLVKVLSYMAINDYFSTRTRKFDTGTTMYGQGIPNTSCCYFNYYNKNLELFVMYLQCMYKCNLISYDYYRHCVLCTVHSRNLSFPYSWIWGGMLTIAVTVFALTPLILYFR